jgi:hypothetical protein
MNEDLRTIRLDEYPTVVFAALAIARFNGVRRM